MGHVVPREKDIEFDVESGGNSSEEDASSDHYSNERQHKNAFRWAWNGILNFEGSDRRESGIESCSNSAKSGDVVDDNLALLVDKGLENAKEQLSHGNGNYAKQKNKPSNTRKPPKPPLPPRGPSLDAGDHKFVKELAELALRKRARIKKMKAVRKMKASKSSSSSYISLSAMVITTIFFLVLILHGVRSASSASVGSMGSPEAAFAADEGLISVQHPKNFTTSEGDAPGPNHPILQDS